MRAKKIIVIDVLEETQQIFEESLNAHCIETNTQINETSETIAINNFSKLISKDPIIGEDFIVKVLRASPIEGHKHITVFDYSDRYKVIEIKEGGKLLMESIISGSVRLFPEIAGPLFDKTDCSVLMDDEEQFETMFGLVFGGWKIARSKF